MSPPTPLKLAGLEMLVRATSRPSSVISRSVLGVRSSTTAISGRDGFAAGAGAVA
jgi:hypothetical protein